MNTIGAAGDLTIRKAVQDDGGDPSTIEFVEVAFPDVPAQLEAGTMDAAWAPDPFRGIVVGGGGTSVLQPYQATIPGLSVLTNITTQKLIDEDPDLVAAYSAAMSEALEWASGHEQEVRDAIATNLKIPAEAAAGITLPTFTWDARRRQHPEARCARGRIRVPRRRAGLRPDDPAAVTARSGCLGPRHPDLHLPLPPADSL